VKFFKPATHIYIETGLGDLNMVDIKTEMTPMRLSLTERRPVELMIEIENNSNKVQMMSYDINLGGELAFDKGGRSGVQTKRFDSLQPGERIRDYFDIYPKVNVSVGEKLIVITAMEHFNQDYKYVMSKKSKELVLRVV